ncbi:MAG: hypothetical protein ACRC5T_05295 [Cetobacterium sp.]
MSELIHISGNTYMLIALVIFNVVDIAVIQFLYEPRDVTMDGLLYRAVLILTIAVCPSNISVWCIRRFKEMILKINTRK